MAEFYTPTQRQLQDEYNTRELADRVEVAITTDELTEDYTAFITARNISFSTVDENEFSSFSYKGGAPGFIRVLDLNTLVFQNYDGNGMFMSQGNMLKWKREGRDLSKKFGKLRKIKRGVATIFLLQRR